MIQVFSPKDLLNKVQYLLNDNKEFIFVGLVQDKVTSIFSVGDSIEDYDIHFTNANGYVILRGIDTKKTDKYVDNLQEMFEPLFALDYLVFDVTTKTFYSDMCGDPDNCCGPNNMLDYATLPTSSQV